MSLSFTAKIKQEICKLETDSPCCLIAELLGVICFAGYIKDNNLFVRSENLAVINRICMITEKTFGIVTKVTKNNSGKTIYKVRIADENNITNVLEELLLIKNTKDMKNFISYGADHSIVEKFCCKKAFLRGAFLVSGSCSDPKKYYHLELVTTHYRCERETVNLLSEMDINVKTIARGANRVIYIKNSEGIANFVGYIGATDAMLEIQQNTIYKDFKNKITRTVNMENANINKIANASAKQLVAIKKIESVIGLDALDASLRELAVLRLENYDASLKELGDKMSKPLSKSGVCHRLAKIVEIADSLKM